MLAKLNAKNDIMSVFYFEMSIYRRRNFVSIRGTKRDTKSHIYKSSAISIKKEHCTR